MIHNTSPLHHPSSMTHPVSSTVWALLLLMLLWSLYYAVTAAWFLADDPALLRYAAQHGVWGNFYDPETWRLTSTANLTPWMQLSLGMDWQWWGLNPYPFYLHHLLAFSFALLCAYHILQNITSAAASGLALCLFITALPVAEIVQHLMVRHYVEGLLFMLVALWAYVHAFKQPQQPWWILGVTAYVLSMTAKEIYVPLVVALVFLPMGTLWQRGWQVLPYALAAAAYVGWRNYMLGAEQLVSGYGVFGSQSVWVLWQFPADVVEVMGWRETWQVGLVLLAVGVALYGLIQRTTLRQWLTGLVILGLVLAPILPVMAILSTRYLVLPWLAVCAGFAWALQYYVDTRRWWGVGLLVIPLLIANGVSLTHATVWNPIWTARKTAESLFILQDGQPQQVLLNAQHPDFHMQSLVWFREQATGQRGALACYDRCICELTGQETFFAYTEGQLQPLVNVPRSDCGAMTQPLSIELSYAQGVINWQFGPYPERAYQVALSINPFMDGQFLPPLPPQGRYPLAFTTPIYLAVKYTSPDGWVTYAPVLTLAPSGVASQVHWQREGE